MGVHPKIYSKEDFVSYLDRNGVSDVLIERFNKLPLSLTHNDKVYKLNINTSWNDDGTTRYDFELNYYNELLYEFMLPYKIFSDFEMSLNFVECELYNMGLLDLTGKEN